ncbi:flavin reductase family protein [Leucobacter sp. M11]|uniref:flavin reductase family protein n=1 Tax=Leucobacter sp. M11 TaxID=2993565 RepID=UPI002D7FCEC4|nr:flavin reductase family protein [Leucobacter sp. M11]MEB4614616.1 flavin reductase family protein [Leucobacter sp. M11]
MSSAPLHDSGHEEPLTGEAPLAGGISPQELKDVFRNYPSGVALVTADDGTRAIAITVTSVISVSAEPPLLVFSASALSSSTPVLLGSKTVVVHILTDENAELAKLGATSGIDRFADTDAWERMPTGEPRFKGVDTWIRGEVVNHFEAGTSTLIVVHALEAMPNPERTGQPLVYHDRTWHTIGDGSRIPDPRRA